jgi:hypothetical protein
MLIELETAKTHLRVYGTDEDALIELLLRAAERAASEFTNRYIYVDQSALDTAKADVPATLNAASAAFDAAISEACLAETETASEFGRFAAAEALTNAKNSARMTVQGIAVNEQIEAAILLTLGHLYENRADTVVGVPIVALPMGAHCLLQPFRVGMGV